MKTALMITATWTLGLIAGGLIMAATHAQNLAAVIALSVPASVTILIIMDRISAHRTKSDARPHR